jgi:trigger factor
MTDVPRPLEPRRLLYVWRSTLLETTVERLEGSRVRVTLNFSVEEIDTAFGKAYRTLGKQVAIPGFRPGKAPRMLLERHLGKEVAPSQVLQDLVPDALEKAVEEQDIRAVGDPELEAEPPVAGEAYAASAVFTVWPEPSIGEWREEKVVRPKLVLDDALIDEGIEGLRSARATSEDVTDRPVEKGDFVRASYQIICEEETLYAPEALPQLYLEVGAEWYSPAVDDDLVGMALGETKDISVTYPEDYDAPRLAGKPAIFQATIDSIQVRRLPELDEAFLSTVGVSDLDGLREHISEERRKEVEPLVKRASRDQALLAVARNTTIDMPVQLVAANVQDRWSDLKEEIDRKGLTLEDYLEEQELTVEQLAKLFRARARRAITTALVVDALAKQESIEVPEDEMEEAVWRLAQSAKTGFSEMQELLERTGQLEEMKRSRLTDRVADWLLEQLTIEEPELSYDELTKGEWLPDMDPADLAEEEPEPPSEGSPTEEPSEAEADAEAEGEPAPEAEAAPEEASEAAEQEEGTAE